MKCPPPAGRLCLTSVLLSWRLAGPPCPSAHHPAKLAPPEQRFSRPSAPCFSSPRLSLGVKSHELELVQIPLDDDVVEAFSITCGTGGGDVASPGPRAVPFPRCTRRICKGDLVPPLASSWLPPAAAVVPPPGCSWPRPLGCSWPRPLRCSWPRPDAPSTAPNAPGPAPECS